MPLSSEGWVCTAQPPIGSLEAFKTRLNGILKLTDDINFPNVVFLKYIAF
jgi:hypothetical protein